MNRDLSLIDDICQFLAPVDFPWSLSGGWAIDWHLGRVTRERCDLDISVPYADRLACLSFFLGQRWQIEGKLGGGFKTIRTLSDYQDDIHYFWGFPKGVDFIGEYIDEGGNRRIDYRRDTQTELDYIEVFFDRLQGGAFIYRRDPRITRQIGLAIVKREGVRYLSPEVVLLFKSNEITRKNAQDFDVVVDSLDLNAKNWLAEALMQTGGKSHPWLVKLKK